MSKEQNTAKAVLKGKYAVLNTYIRKEKGLSSTASPATLRNKKKSK